LMALRHGFTCAKNAISEWNSVDLFVSVSLIIDI